MLNKVRLLTLALLFHATSSWAMPMDYSFDIDWTDGGLNGTSSTVFVTLDGLTGTGNEFFRPISLPPQQLVSFLVTIDGQTFEADDDNDFPAFPDMQFENGALSRVSYLKQPPVDPVYLGIEFSTNIVNDVIFCPQTLADCLLSQSLFSFGEVNVESFEPIDDGTVPVPATLALFGLGLAGLGWSQRKKA